jgi:hypothetical protein
LKIEEIKKYENKLKFLRKFDKNAILKHKPIFLNYEQTRSHFGYLAIMEFLKKNFVK